MKVAVNPPKTPVTTGSKGVAAATVPNVCKMPGPPAPFVPTPLPNVGRSGTSPQGYSTTVTIEGNPVAIKGATFGSMGDIASKGTGGGLVSANTHGPTAFVAPGSMNVQIEGQNVQLLGDTTTNNNGSPPNATTTAELQDPNVGVPFVVNIDCEDKMTDPRPGKAWDNCMCQQLCAKIKQMEKARAKGKIKAAPGARKQPMYAGAAGGKARFIKKFNRQSAAGPSAVKRHFIHKCAYEKYRNEVYPNPPTQGGTSAPFNADHMHEGALGGSLTSMSNMKMVDKRVNQSISFESYDAAAKPPIVAHPSCNCPKGPAN
jgi:uncharacterized Zn-binding protein involved in type VI secretion